MSRNYKFHNPSAPYFVSFATVNWIDVFIRESYCDILAKCLTFCREQKGMEVYAFCFMPSHVHLIFRAENGDPTEVLRDFKKFTAKQLLQAIQNNPIESRREWMLQMFEEAERKKSNITKYQFWQHHNHPIELWSTSVIKKKLDYIHNNPVKAGFVTNPIDWKYSSARNFADDHTVLRIDEMGFLG